MEDRQMGCAAFSAWRSREVSDKPDWDSQWARKLVPLSSKPKALAQSGAGKAINRAGGIFAIQDEDIGQQALDGARIDIALNRNRRGPGATGSNIPPADANSYAS